MSSHYHIAIQRLVPHIYTAEQLLQVIVLPTPERADVAGVCTAGMRSSDLLLDTLRELTT
jgi:hypothetical protein